MTPTQLIKTIGLGNVSRTAERLGVTRACVYHWRRTGKVSAEGQLAAQRLSKGRLRAK